MNIKSIKNELQNIISGKSGYSYDAVIQATTNYLRTSQRTSPMAEAKHENRRKETAKLVEFVVNDFLKISESGISNPKTINELRQAGFDGFLIGENFMKTSEPEKGDSAFIIQYEILFYFFKIFIYENNYYFSFYVLIIFICSNR